MDFFKEILTESFVKAIVLLALTVYVSYIAPAIKKLLEKMRENKELEMLTKVAETFVKSAEMRLNSDQGQVKKQEVLQKMLEFVNKNLDLNITESMIEDALEKAVLDMNTERDKILANMEVYVPESECADDTSEFDAFAAGNR